MITIRVPFGAVRKVIGDQKPADGAALRRSSQCCAMPCDEGLLLYHTLTGELLLLSKQEAETADTASPIQAELAKRWFCVPRSFNEVSHCDQVKAVIRLLKPPGTDLKSAVIFTTSDCNARCFYCFEAGQRRIPMSEQTARDAADFLIRSCTGKKLRFRWFGGEPLLNAGVIDIISQKVRDAGITYSAEAVTNGYLLDPEKNSKAKELWNLRSVVITLDGTEEIYNRTKAYVHAAGSAYRRVLDNIENALRAGIHVAVNLNMDARNAEDLTRLADELAARFRGMDGFSARAGLLIEYVGAIHRFADTETALAALRGLNDRLRMLGIHNRRPLDRGIMLDNCMADQDSYITILPDGRLGKCEHFIDGMAVGSLYSEERDEALIRAFKEAYPPEERCGTCAYYPLCRRLKLCNGQKEHCDELDQGCRLNLLRERILNTYEAYRQGKGETGHEDQG